MFSTPAFAQAAGAAPNAATGPLALIMNLLPMLAILVVFYFLLIRPQQQRLKAHQAMVANLKKGDEVVTSGGMIGKIKTVSDTEVGVDLGHGLVVNFVRNTITEVRGPQIIPPTKN